MSAWILRSEQVAISGIYCQCCVIMVAGTGLTDGYNLLLQVHQLFDFCSVLAQSHHKLWLIQKFPVSHLSYLRHRTVFIIIVINLSTINNISGCQICISKLSFVCMWLFKHKVILWLFEKLFVALKNPVMWLLKMPAV